MFDAVVIGIQNYLYIHLELPGLRPLILALIGSVYLSQIPEFCIMMIVIYKIIKVSSLSFFFEGGYLECHTNVQLVKG